MFSARRVPAKVVQQATRSFSPVSRLSEFATDLFGAKPQRIPLDQAPVEAHTLGSGTKHTARDDVFMTVLSNGVKVVTHSGPSLTSTISVHIAVGSRYENPDVRGITHFMEKMLLKSSVNRLEHVLFRDMAKIGAEITCTSSREGLTITGQSVDHITRVLGALAEITVNPAFKINEVIEAKEEYIKATESQNSEPDVAVNNAIHTAAFGNVGLGAPQYALPSHLEVFTPDTLREWHRLFFSGDRVTVAACGVDHKTLAGVAGHMFNGLHQSSNMETVETVYQGSSIRLTDRDYRGLTHVALGFNAASWADKDVYAASVLQTLLGGGNAYSSGGPGKGMHSRLYQDVLSKHNWIESATCFNSIYSDAGLFGFYASAPPEAAGAVVDVLLQETRKMTTVSEEELVRSKNMLLSNVLSYFDNPAARTEEMARSVSTSGRFHTNDLIEGIRSVTKEDLERVGTKIMASPISSATYGKATAIPREIKL